MVSPLLMVDAPDVGRNMQDQPIFFLQWAANGDTLFSFLNDPDAINAALAQYEQNKTGLAASSIVFNTIGFLRLPDNSSLLENGDPSSGPHAAHYQISFIVRVLIRFIIVQPLMYIGHFQRKRKPSRANGWKLDIWFGGTDIPHFA